MEQIKDYLKQFTPSSDRLKDKYYPEMQQLAYNLIRYLRMDNDSNEDKHQGNYNFTYLRENLTEEDYLFIVDKFLRNIPIYKVKEMMKETWNSISYNGVFDEGIPVEKYRELEDKYEELKFKMKNILDEIDE